MPTPDPPPGFDFTDPDIHVARLPVEKLAELRRTASIWWNAQSPDHGGFGDGGHWVVSKHKDVREVSLRSDVFSSAKNCVVPWYRRPPAQRKLFQFVLTLAVASNETTRNSITQGMMAFVAHPDQWELFRRQRPATTADEIIRWPLRSARFSARR